MRQYRVVLSMLPGLFGELLEERIRREEDIELTRAEGGPVALHQAIGNFRANVVILPVLPGVCDQLVSSYPELLVVALAPDGEFAFVYRRVTCAEPKRMTVKKLLKTIRKAAPNFYRLSTT